MQWSFPAVLATSWPRRCLDGTRLPTNSRSVGNGRRRMSDRPRFIAVPPVLDWRHSGAAAAARPSRSWSIVPRTASSFHYAPPVWRPVREEWEGRLDPGRRGRGGRRYRWRGDAECGRRRARQRLDGARRGLRGAGWQLRASRRYHLGSPERPLSLGCESGGNRT